MAELIQIGAQASKAGASSCAVRPPAKAVFWLQGITLVWMLFECGISLTAAATACSPSMLAFGSDSLVELLSATVVLLQFLPRFPLSSERANRTAGVLLFALAAVVALVAIASLAPHRRPETSLMGIGITIAALVVMPILARLKRREAIRTGNAALAADAVQSATCAYLAAIALLGLAANALFKIAWLDSLAAVAALPLLIKEGRDAWRGKICACC